MFTKKARHSHNKLNFFYFNCLKNENFITLTAKHTAAKAAVKNLECRMSMTDD